MTWDGVIPTTGDFTKVVIYKLDGSGVIRHFLSANDAKKNGLYTLHPALLAYNMAVIEGVDLSKVTASFQLCLDYLIPVIKGTETWPHTGYSNDKWEDFYAVFLLADTHFDTADTAAYILTNYGEHFDEANSDLLYKK